MTVCTSRRIGRAAGTDARHRLVGCAGSGWQHCPLDAGYAGGSMTDDYTRRRSAEIASLYKQIRAAESTRKQVRLRHRLEAVRRGRVSPRA